MTKPTVFNYGAYEKALEEIRDLEKEVDLLKKQNEKLMFKAINLKEENTNLQIHVRILEADLRAAKGEK